jgi:EpsG-like putative glucosyltransferase
MAFYLTFFSLATVIACGAASTRGRLTECLSFLYFLLIVIFAGLRGDVGQDTYNYGDIYNNISDWNILLNLKVEPVFAGLASLHKLIFNSTTGFLFSISLIQGALLYYSTRKLKYRWIFLLIYLYTFYLNFHFNVIRAGLALLFFLSSISTKNNKISSIFIIGSFLTHFSMVAFLPVYILLKKADFKHIFSVLIIGTIFLTLMVFYAQDYLIEKIKIYGVFNDLKLSFSFLSIAMISFGLFCFLVSGTVKYSILFTFFYFSVIFYLSNEVDIFYRLREPAFIILVFVFLDDSRFRTKKLEFKPYFIYLLFLVIWTTLQVWANNISEADAISGSGIGKKEFTYIPYEPYWESAYR